MYSGHETQKIRKPSAQDIAYIRIKLYMIVISVLDCIYPDNISVFNLKISDMKIIPTTGIMRMLNSKGVIVRPIIDGTRQRTSVRIAPKEK